MSHTLDAMKNAMVGVAALLAAAVAAGAQDAAPPAPPPPPPASEPAPQAEPAQDGTEPAPEPTPLPGLDELLGLPTPERPVDEETAKLFEALDPSKVELDRKLTAQEAADQLASAVQQMEETAFRIEKIRDTGIVTQRLQEEILTKLDVLIRQAESSSSSSSSSQSQSQQSQPQPGDQQASSQPQEGTSQDPGSNAQGGLPPFEQNPGDQINADAAAWGALPARIREKLLEGRSDYFSRYYEALTQEYYKRLAEEAE